VNPKVWQLLERAREDIEAAGDILRTAHPERAADDAYYAMFHAAEALLLSLGLETSSHSATHAAFGLHFSKTGVLNEKLHRYLINAFNARVTATYDVTVKLRLEQVQEVLSWAKEFVAAAEEYRLKGR
jgi:uncharacterized protein (UPF0332 family)